jgi:hypothetical protein
LEGGEQGKDHRERGKSKGMLVSCSPHPVMMVEPGSCAQPYTVYGGKAKRGQVSEWASWVCCSVEESTSACPLIGWGSEAMPPACLLAFNGIAVAK